MNATATLTRREAQMAELMAWGATKKDVANTLHISVRTVENTARNIFEKAEVTKVNELSAWWFCTHYNIPLHLSPIARNVVSVAFIGLILFAELFSPQAVVRPMRTRTSTSRTVRARRRELNNTYTIEL